MRLRELFIIALPFALLMLIVCGAKSVGSIPFPNEAATNARMFIAKGVVQELKPDARTVVIRHEAISNYMAAMTMPFKVKNPKELAGLQRGVGWIKSAKLERFPCRQMKSQPMLSLRKCKPSAQGIRCWTTSSPMNWDRR
jgi:Cu/Ag efflux protein CusF